MIELSAYEKRLLDIINTYQNGLSEYELLELLNNKERSRDVYRDNLNLFKMHFLLFHSLYCLQQKLYQNQTGSLDVDPLRIIVQPYVEIGYEALSKTDPLRDYYLDASNLDTASEENVESLLTSFWEKYLANDHRQEALEALGLKDPVDHKTIRKRYKQLAMENHPDRGGDKDKLQAINAAMKLLKH